MGREEGCCYILLIWRLEAGSCLFHESICSQNTPKEPAFEGSALERVASGGWVLDLPQQPLRKVYFTSKKSSAVTFANSMGSMELEPVPGVRSVPTGQLFPLDTPAAWQTGAPTLVHMAGGCSG